MGKPSPTTPGEEVYRLPDIRLQTTSINIAGLLSLGLFLAWGKELSGFLRYLHSGLLILVIAMPILALMGRQQTRTFFGEQRFLLSRRFLGKSWREDSLPFVEIDRLAIVGDQVALQKSPFHRVKGRLIVAVRNDGSNEPLVLADTPQAAFELAEELGRLVERPVVDTSPVAEARRALDLSEKPAELSSEIQHLGRRLRVALNARHLHQRAVLMVSGLLLGFGLSLSGLFMAAHRQEFWSAQTTNTVFFISVVVCSLGLLWIVRRFNTPEILIASRDGLEVKLPGWRQWSHLRPASAVRIEVQEKKDALMLLVADDSHQYLVGLGPSAKELQWLREALLKALADDFAPWELSEQFAHTQEIPGTEQRAHNERPRETTPYR